MTASTIPPIPAHPVTPGATLHHPRPITTLAALGLADEQQADAKLQAAAERDYAGRYVPEARWQAPPLSDVIAGLHGRLTWGRRNSEDPLVLRGVYALLTGEADR